MDQEAMNATETVSVRLARMEEKIDGISQQVTRMNGSVRDHQSYIDSQKGAVRSGLFFGAALWGVVSLAASLFAQWVLR